MRFTLETMIIIISTTCIITDKVNHIFDNIYEYYSNIGDQQILDQFLITFMKVEQNKA